MNGGIRQVNGLIAVFGCSDYFKISSDYGARGLGKRVGGALIFSGQSELWLKLMPLSSGC
jgi:hypothetical protein